MCPVGVEASRSLAATAGLGPARAWSPQAMGRVSCVYRLTLIRATPDFASWVPHVMGTVATELARH